MNRKQFSTLRKVRRNYGVQIAMRDAAYIAPDLEVRHPPCGGGWWQPGRMQARGIGSIKWREI